MIFFVLYWIFTVIGHAQNATVPLTCHRMTVLERFAFHVTGQRPKDRSPSEWDSVKICATRRVQFSIQLFGTGFRANRRIARGNRQRLSNGQNDYLHARLGAIPILQERDRCCDREKIHPDCCFTLQNKLKSHRESGIAPPANRKCVFFFGTADRHTVSIKLVYTTRVIRCIHRQ